MIWMTHVRLCPVACTALSGPTMMIPRSWRHGYEHLRAGLRQGTRRRTDQTPARSDTGPDAGWWVANSAQHIGNAQRSGILRVSSTPSFTKATVWFIFGRETTDRLGRHLGIPGIDAKAIWCGSRGIVRRKQTLVRTIIYMLIDPESSQARYVGKTKDAKERLRCHIKDCQRGYIIHRDHWLRSIVSKGLHPIMEELESFDGDCDGEWQEAERFWISYLRSVGCRLVNTESGGDGPHKMSDETKRKLSSLFTGRRRGPMSPDTKLKLSAAKMGVKRAPFSQEWREKLRAASRGRHRSPETRAK